MRAAAAAIAIGLATATACAYAINPARVYLPLGSELLVDVDTPYHHISVIDDAEGTRQLRFDQYVESQIEVDPPHRGLSPYTTYFHLAFLPQPKIRRALFIGAGGGVGPRSFRIHDPAMQIEVVDIDQKVLDLARSHFYLDDSPSIKTIAADGRMYVRAAESGAYDAIVLDAFSIGGRIPFHLVTREFIELCRARLAPGGVFLMNINSAQRGPQSRIFRSMLKTVEAAFPNNAHAFSLGRRLMDAEQSTNIIFVGINSDQQATPEKWAEWAESYESNSYVDRALVEQMIPDLLVTPPDVSQDPMFTDDYAPIETMPF